MTTHQACPPCFTPKDWVRWRTPPRGVDVPKPKTFCEDCLPERQAQMLAANRCMYPETFFVRDADGFVHGHRPPAKETP